MDSSNSITNITRNIFVNSQDTCAKISINGSSEILAYKVPILGSCLANCILDHISKKLSSVDPTTTRFGFITGLSSNLPIIAQCPMAKSYIIKIIPEISENDFTSLLFPIYQLTISIS